MKVVEEVNAHSRVAMITNLYEEVFPLVATYIQRKGGNLEMAKEVFQEAIVIYYEKLIGSDFKPEKDDKAYLIGIAKNRWLKYCTTFFIHESLEYVEITEDKIPKPLTQKLLHYLKQTGEKCMDVLQAFYYEKLNMMEIAERFGYTSERSATVQKYKCLEKVRNEVKRKSLNYEDFLD